MEHRKRVQHFHEVGHFHELTFSCYQRKALLTNDVWREKLSRSLDLANQTEETYLVAFVFMPEHVHLLVYPRQKEPNIGRYLSRIKQPFSKQIKDLLLASGSDLLTQLTVQERPGKTCFRFWQEGGGYDRNVYSKPYIEHSINYLHENPVRRGLCKKATDWKWSSARYYIGEGAGEQTPMLPFIQGIPAGTFD